MYLDICKFFRFTALYFRIVCTLLFLTWIEVIATEHLSVYFRPPNFVANSYNLHKNIRESRERRR